MIKNKGILYVLFGISAIFVILALIFYVNTLLAKCHENDKYDNTTKLCYYNSNGLCKQNEQIGNIANNTVCTYQKEGSLNKKFMITLLIVLGVAVLILLLVVLFGGESRPTKKPPLPPEVYIKAYKLYVARKFKIPIVNGVPKEDAFEDTFQKHQSTHGDESWIRLQLEVKEGKRPCVIVIEGSLHVDVEDILYGFTDSKETVYDKYNRPPGYPTYTPPSETERIIRDIAETNPEKAAELSQQVLEKKLDQINATTQKPREMQQPVVAPVYQPRPARRPWWRRRSY